MNEYREGNLVVRFDADVCVHCGNCVKGLPDVFKPGRKPWIDLTKATLEAIEAQVAQCPSGALSAVREA